MNPIYEYDTDSDSSVSSQQNSDVSSTHSSIKHLSNTVKHFSSKWCEEEDNRLSHAVQLYGQKSWRTISNYVGSKTNLQCRQRYLKVIAPGIRKGKWSEDEDALLCLVMSQGIMNWKNIADKVPGRTSKQCRERWNHYLQPGVVKTPFDAAEDATLASLYKIHGNHWSCIAKHMPGRTENQVRFRVEHLKLNKINTTGSQQPSKNIIRVKEVVYHVPSYKHDHPCISVNMASVSCDEDTPRIQISPVVTSHKSFQSVPLSPSLLSPGYPICAAYAYSYPSEELCLSGDYLRQFLACMADDDLLSA